MVTIKNTSQDKSLKLLRMKHIQKKPYKRQIIFGSIGLAVFALIAIYKYEYFACYLFGDAQNYRGEFAKILTPIAGGLLILFGLWLNYERTKMLVKQTDNQTEQIELTRKGQVDERFKIAIEHLGSDKSTIILGGIYALHRIAKDDKTYRETVFNILCSYIREKTSDDKDWSDFTQQERENYKTPIVIQTIIDLLFKKDILEEYIYEGKSAKLSGIRCINADFSNAYLFDAELMNAHLEGSNFNKATLDKAILDGAHLISARFCDAFLVGAIINEAHLEDTLFRKAILYDAVIYKTCLRGASLCGAHMEGTDLSESFFEGAELNEAHLEGSILDQTHFEGAHLNQVYLEGAYLNKTHFAGANLFGSKFHGVYSERLYDGNFEKVLRMRMGKESEYSKAIFGKLDDTVAANIVKCFSMKIKDRSKVDYFSENINRATKRITTIENCNPYTGILIKERAEEIIASHKNVNQDLFQRRF